eukprot:COSAG01_NODE_8519_length_2755_cov_8.227410_1_plen_147_part_10
MCVPEGIALGDAPLLEVARVGVLPWPHALPTGASLGHLPALPGARPRAGRRAGGATLAAAGRQHQREGGGLVEPLWLVACVCACTASCPATASWSVITAAAAHLGDSSVRRSSEKSESDCRSRALDLVARLHGSRQQHRRQSEACGS